MLFSLYVSLLNNFVIFIEKRNDLINTSSSTEEFEAPAFWTEGCIAECDREIVIIS